jgi:hypothetical protein
VRAMMPAEPDVAPKPAPDMTEPPSAIGIGALIPREPFGLPIAAWVGIGAFVVLAALFLGGMFK